MCQVATCARGRRGGRFGETGERVDGEATRRPRRVGAASEGSVDVDAPGGGSGRTGEGSGEVLGGAAGVQAALQVNHLAF